MQKYVVMVIDADEDAWETMTPEQRQVTYDIDYSFGQRLSERGGRVVGGAGLEHSSRSRVIRRGADGGALHTAGPFAETTEQVAGFFIVECPSEEALLEAGERMLEAHAALEIRPVPED